MKTYLIADSGGTKTDWCFVNHLGERSYFSTSSFHPSEWNDAFKNHYLKFWEEKSLPKTTQVMFYGAGCSRIENQHQLKNYFNDWGFEDVSVDSDLIGAGLALLGEENGHFAILGTGSVFCHYEHKSIRNYYGGFGYLIGDEGSGYAFGRKLLNSLLNKEFSLTISEKIHELLGSKETILKKVYSEESKSFISSIPFLIRELIDKDEIVELHKENITDFIEKYILSKRITEIALIGSYAYNHLGIVHECLAEYGVKIKKSLQFPIVELTDCLLRDSF